MKKSFCDLCGKPAIETSGSGIYQLVRKTSPLQGDNRFHLKVYFTYARLSCPTSDDAQADICTGCLEQYFNGLLTRLKSEAKPTE